MARCAGTAPRSRHVSQVMKSTPRCPSWVATLSHLIPVNVKRGAKARFVEDARRKGHELSHIGESLATERRCAVARNRRPRVRNGERRRVGEQFLFGVRNTF